jgi:hypothetical protein
MEWITVTSKSKAVKPTVALPKAVKPTVAVPKVAVPKTVKQTVLSPLKKKIDMSHQNCNYCKGTGHRIHAMDEFGTYVIGPDGERILACPVLLRKKPTVNIDTEFPALPGSEALPTKATFATIIGINGALKEKVLREREMLKQQKKQRHEAWKENYMSRMLAKHGPLWYYQVRDTVDETDCAILLRRAHQQKLEEEQDREDMMWEEIHREWDSEEKQKENEREARRALMTEAERLEEEDQYMDDLDDALWNATMAEGH